MPALLNYGLVISYKIDNVSLSNYYKKTMNTIDFTKLVRKNILSLKPYEPKDIPCKIKLDANESPYTIDVKLNKGIFKKINRYPDPESRDLKKAISRQLKIARENILLGNGSDELIYYLITVFGGPILYPTPSFSMYGIISQSLGEKNIGIPLDKDFDIDLEMMLSAIKKYNPRLIFLSSPNNPTGNCFSSERILKIIEESKGLVVVDEAYQPFSSKMGFLPLLKDYKNLAITRTLSKIGFAALRIGFLIGDRDLIKEVNKVRLPFNINSLSQTLAIEAFRNRSIIDSQIKKIISERERVYRELKKIEGIKIYPSESNFILFKVKNSDKVYQRLIKEGILIRNLGDSIKNGLRVTIGTYEENNIFLDALRKIVGEINEKCQD